MIKMSSLKGEIDIKNLLSPLGLPKLDSSGERLVFKHPCVKTPGPDNDVASAGLGASDIP